MSLAHLDQLVPLERGEAGLLLQALTVLVGEATRYEGGPVPALQLLTALPLLPLCRKLRSRHLRELAGGPRPGRRSARPHQLRVSVEQLAALLHHRLALYCCGLSAEDNLVLQQLVGKFQQKSLNLARYVKF